LGVDVVARGAEVSAFVARNFWVYGVRTEDLVQDFLAEIVNRNHLRGAWDPRRATLPQYVRFVGRAIVSRLLGIGWYRGADGRNVRYQTRIPEGAVVHLEDGAPAWPSRDEAEERDGSIDLLARVSQCNALVDCCACGRVRPCGEPAVRCWVSEVAGLHVVCASHVELAPARASTPLEMAHDAARVL
jgi:hypothetical protein